MAFLRFARNITKLTSSYRSKLILEAYGNWIKKGDKVLDIGCGNGIITNFLNQKLDIKITGCDVKNHLIFKIPFIKMESGKLPFRKKVFDVSLLNDVLHHISRDEQITLINQTLQVSDKLLIFEAEPTLTSKVADILLNKFHYGDLKAPLTFRGAAEWNKLFKSLALKTKTIKLEKAFWYPFSHIAFEIRKV